MRACFMIELIMNVGLGFLAASLLALVTIPLVHDCAVVAAVEQPAASRELLKAAASKNQNS